MNKSIACLLALAALAGCTDAKWQKATRYGDAARVTCYTANGVFFDDFSTGAVSKEESGADGYFFVSQATGRLTEVTGDCVVDYGAKREPTFQAKRP
jgi:hypothetical protein